MALHSYIVHACAALNCEPLGVWYRLVYQAIAGPKVLYYLYGYILCECEVTILCWESHSYKVSGLGTTHTTKIGTVIFMTL